MVCLPIGKNVAFRQWWASAASTAGVLSGQGPSSKERTTSPGFKKSCCLKCSNPKPGPPVVSICTVRAMPNASGLPGQETTRGAGGVVVAGADAAASGWADSGAVIGAVVPAATLLADGTARVLSGIVGTDVTEAVAVEIGATLATVETGSAGGAGLEAVGGLEAGASAATDVGGFKMLIRVSATAAKTATTTIVQTIMMRIGPLRVIHAALSIKQAEALLHAPHTQ